MSRLGPEPKIVLGVNKLISSEWFMGSVRGVKSLKGTQLCLCLASLGSRALAKLSIARHQS